MLVLAAFTALTALVGVLLWVTRSHLFEPTPAVGLEDFEIVVPVLRHARRRSLIGLAAGAAVFSFLIWYGWVEPVFIGLPYAFAPGLGVAAGLLVFSCMRSPRLPKAQRRSADIVPRRPWSFGPRWSFAVPSAFALGLVAVLLLIGIKSGDEDNLDFFYGWFLSIPLIVIIAMIMGAVFFALARTANAPAMSDPDLAPLDRHWREASTRMITKLGMAALLGTAGIAAYVEGSFVQGVIAMFAADSDVTHGSAWVTAVGQQVVGAVLAVTSMVFWILAVLDTLSLRAPSARPAVFEAAGRP